MNRGEADLHAARECIWWQEDSGLAEDLGEWRHARDASHLSLFLQVSFESL